LGSWLMMQITLNSVGGQMNLRMVKWHPITFMEQGFEKACQRGGLNDSVGAKMNKRKRASGTVEVKDGRKICKK